MQLSDIGYIKSLLQKHGFQFSKALGQNFIVDSSVCPKMAELALGGDKDFGVIEIGPGIGVLTRELSRCAKKVVAIELDKRLIPILKETLADCDNAEVIHGDAMKLDLHALIKEKFEGMRVAVCANLPYYITSPIIMGLLEAKLPLDNITVMVQKEAAERLCAAPGDRECGAVSAAVSFYSKPEILFGVGRDSFLPPPKVDSAVISLKILENPPISPKDEAFFFKCVKAAFAQRRKTVANSLSATMHIDKSKVTEILESANISPLARAEALTLKELSDLSDALYSYTK
ncbi:MAG: 16S rRNA (adenine(1518)-N(6)/adenine(1519)-N(6))-dimethyltransferase RsmA [Oscillospiraceae bacterium]|nr:16S rRNA (adenine(1518)-N(6)/adenine(1519)-N(6))-dimethyltransferase RsmA [Oscillospiraceae bacterium]